MSSSEGLEGRIGRVLARLNEAGGYAHSLVCTDQGLLVAHAGDTLPSEQIAGITSLFDDIVLRARRDLGFGQVDEVTLFDPAWDRLVVKPVPLPGGETRFFLVLRAPARATWRRHTQRALRELTRLLHTLIAEDP